MLKKSIKLARSFEAKKGKGNEYAANVPGYNSKRFVGLEFELSQQQRQLFLCTENALVRESAQLVSCFIRPSPFSLSKILFGLCISYKLASICACGSMWKKCVWYSLLSIDASACTVAHGGTNDEMDCWKDHCFVRTSRNNLNSCVLCVDSSDHFIWVPRNVFYNQLEKT